VGDVDKILLETEVLLCLFYNDFDLLIKKYRGDFFIMKISEMFVFVVYSLCISLFMCGCGNETPEENYTEIPRIESSTLKDTVITPHLEAKIVEDKNVIYCSSFQLAWNMMQDDIIKEEILLDGDPPMAAFLNKQISTDKDLSEDCYVAMADKLTEKFLAEINAALKEKFGDQAPPEVKEPINQLNYFAYAYLFKNLLFKNSFESLKDPVNFQFGDKISKVKAFGIKEYKDNRKCRKMAKQLSVIDYDFAEGKNFIISLKSKSENDEIILAKIEPEENLLKTIEKVQAKVKESKDYKMYQRDTLQIPVLDFNLRSSFNELCGKNMKNEGWEEYFFIKAMQDIRFRLNEKGALLKSEVRLDMVLCKSTNLIFDKAFLIYLRQKDARYPYFAIWTGNDEILQKMD
jgi:hypothetical protein